jgi:5'-nucleotidase
MRVLLTNDDGIAAPGLACLRKAAMAMGASEVWVVAPSAEHSMCGHRLTTHQPLLTKEMEPGSWAVEGTPADCVRVALFALGLKPDWVFSGVNAGGNLGQDLVISGTCAGAREAAYHGVGAIAFSHYLRREVSVDWHRTAQWTMRVARDLQAKPCASGQWWCVNFPHHPPGAMEMPRQVLARPARSPLPVSFRSVDGGYLYNASYASRARDKGSDVEACFEGHISVVCEHV